ncbi:acyltransferase family protein [Petrachloros mirabilis]
MAITAPSISRAIPAAATTKSRVGTRLLYIDNIRVFLTILVLLHHLMITYAGTGSWYYTEGRQDSLTLLVGNWFCGLDQAYFMGLFLLISAYFVPGSYDRKGALHFLKDRLIRLGIPLAIFSWVINPLFIYIGLVLTENLELPFWSYFPGEYFKTEPLIGAGPLWFVEVLLIFSLVYVVWRLVTPARPVNPPQEVAFPSNRAIVIFAFLLGLAGFAVRIVFVMDQYFFEPLNLQFPFFAQYIALFVLGLIAFRRDWLSGLSDAMGRLWLSITILLILVRIPIMQVLDASGDPNALKGGLHWQSLLYSLWEAFFCVSMCIAVIYFFRLFLNQRGRFSNFLVPNAYTAYIIHAPIITILTFSIRDVDAYPLVKWAVVALIAVPLCFALGALIRKLPYTERVL